MSYAYEGWDYAPNGKVLSLGAQAVGVASDSIRVQGLKTALFEFTVATIGTNVVLRAEGSLDDSVWFNLDDSGTDLTVTANGQYAMLADLERVIPFIRLLWVSKSGGSPTVAGKVTMN